MHISLSDQGSKISRLLWAYCGFDRDSNGNSKNVSPKVPPDDKRKRTSTILLGDLAIADAMKSKSVHRALSFLNFIMMDQGIPDENSIKDESCQTDQTSVYEVVSTAGARCMLVYHAKLNPIDLVLILDHSGTRLQLLGSILCAICKFAKLQK